MTPQRCVVKRCGSCQIDQVAATSAAICALGGALHSQLDNLTEVRDNLRERIMGKYDMEHVHAVADAYRGLAEFPGAKHNPEILQMFSEAGHSWVKDDETPWCAAFVGAVLAQSGLRGTGKLNARSYMDWGVETKTPERGDVVVLWRGTRDSWKGHVGFYVGTEGNYIHILGGNQGDSVSVAKYPKDRLLGYRTAETPRTVVASSTTLQASVVAGASTVATGVTAVSALDGTAQTIAVIGALVVMLALAWIMRERVRKWAQGDR